jgi:hypothetical protein
MRDLMSNDLQTAAHLAAVDDDVDGPDPSEYLDDAPCRCVRTRDGIEPCAACEARAEADEELDAYVPAHALSESEQEWRAEMREDALQGGEL